MSKKYVKVNIDVNEEGRITPLRIIYNDTTFLIDKVLECRMAPNLKVGGLGMRYTIRINGKPTFLWEENGRWWVETKN